MIIFTADVNRVDDGTGDFPKGGPQAPSGPGPVDSGPIVESPAGVMVDKKQAGHGENFIVTSHGCQKTTACIMLS